MFVLPKIVCFCSVGKSLFFSIVCHSNAILTFHWFHCESGKRWRIIGKRDSSGVDSKRSVMMTHQKICERKSIEMIVRHPNNNQHTMHSLLTCHFICYVLNGFVCSNGWLLGVLLHHCRNQNEKQSNGLVFFLRRTATAYCRLHAIVRL